MGKPEKGKSVTIEKLLELAHEEDLLHMRIVSGENTLYKEISTSDINRPGLALAGDYDYFDYDRISGIRPGRVSLSYEGSKRKQP